MSKHNISFRSRIDRLVGFWLGTITWITGSLAIFIIGFLAWHAWPAFSEIGVGRMFSDQRWLPMDEGQPQYQILPLLIGSLLVTVGAILWAGPLAVLAAIFNFLYAPSWLRIGLDRLFEILAGVPSVVFGFWGLTCVVPLINHWQPFGLSLLAGIVVLGLMIVPTIAMATRSALKTVEVTQLQAAQALGLSNLSLLRAVVIPRIRRGVVAGCILGITRAIGETMAVLMVCGSVPQIPGSVFDPIRTITSNIALEMGDATGVHRDLLFATGLILLLIVTALTLAFHTGLRIRRAADA